VVNQFEEIELVCEFADPEIEGLREMVREADALASWGAASSAPTVDRAWGDVGKHARQASRRAKRRQAAALQDGLGARNFVGRFLIVALAAFIRGGFG
jgi:hypothetical protein